MTLELQTDTYAEETAFVLLNMTGNSLWALDDELANNQVYNYGVCVDPLSCYLFEIIDSFGDG